MRQLRWALFVTVAGLLPAFGLTLRAAPPPPLVLFHRIGDLAGGYEFSTVRDVTKVGSVIYAVGGSAIRNQFVCFGTFTPGNSGCVTAPNGLGADTPILWTRDGTNTPVMTILPNLVANTGPQSGMTANAITPDASYIASITHDQATGPSRVATRVTTSGLATINLNAPTFTAFTSPTVALSISSDGTILYGSVTSGGVGRAARFDINAGTSTLIPLLNAGDTTNAAAVRGTSADGSVAVGASSGGAAGVNAFRYVNGVGVSAIPRLPGGTFNRPVAISPNGNVVLMTGSSTGLLNGGIYTYDTTNPASPVLTNFGSPIPAWTTTTMGGMTSDGSVIVTTFAPANSTQFDARGAYIHNANGWFQLESALASGGIDVLNLALERLAVTGISPDGTLVYGQGRHDSVNGPVIEGFVAEFPLGFLASFNVPAVPPANSSIVGAWEAVDLANDPTASNPTILVFLADGTFFHIEANHDPAEIDGTNGFERGVYSWVATPGAAPGTVTGAFSIATRLDTNGTTGFSDLNGISGFTLDVTGDNLSFLLSPCPDPDPQACTFAATRIKGGPLEPLVGAWLSGDPRLEDASTVLVLLNNGDYYFAQDGPGLDPNGQDGIEKGTWSWSPATGVFATTTTVDTNGQWGLNSTFPLPGSSSDVSFMLSPSGLVVVGNDGGPDTFPFYRVVDPAALPSTLLRADFNGDGKSDFVWQHADGRAAAWLMDGLGLTSGATLLGPGTGWSIRHVGDFNGDGKTDIVWQHTDGSTALWLMNGLSLLGGGGLLGPGTGWSAVQVGDFNGDGKSDIVLQHTDGSAALWLMNGASILAGGGLLGPGTGWSVAGLGDFNGDGKKDLVWQHTNGSAALWLMNGLSLSAGGGLLGPGTGWGLRHVADFNGDGKSDLVWQQADGRVVMWLMNGLALTAGGGLVGAGTGWDPRLVTDLNGDGKSDLVWQHTDGSTAAWLMNGLTLSGGGGLIGPGTGWTLRQASDFSGDGKSDLVWLRADGSSAMWLMNGLTLTSGGGLLGPATGWSPAP